MRFVRSMEHLAPNTPERARAKLRSSHGHLTVTKTYMGPLGIVYTVLGFTAALIFFFRRSWWVAKALAVPPLAGTIVEYYKKSHDGISPVAVLGIALMLHAVGDVVIALAGVIESMPFFLLGHFAYCRSFARGCDVSRRRFNQFEGLKKVAIISSIVFAVAMFTLLEPSFEGPLLKVILLLYVVAICLMFVISLFGRSRLLILGSGLYLISDCIIALATFVFPKNPLAQWVDLNCAWPIYWAGQLFLTMGALNGFLDLQLEPHPTKNQNGLVMLLVNIFSVLGLIIIAWRRLFR